MRSVALIPNSPPNTSDKNGASQSSRSKTLQSSERAADAEALWNLRKSLDEDDKSKLDEMTALLPLIFKSKDAQELYFTGSSWRYSRGWLRRHVGRRDISDTVTSLSDFSLRAAQRGDLEVSQRALELAIDVLTLPLDITPPRELNAGYPDESGKPAKLVGTSGYVEVTFALIPGLRSIKRTLAGIGATSKHLSLLMQPAQKEMMIISETFASYRKLISASLEKKETETPEYAQMHKKYLMLLRKQLAELKSAVPLE